MFKNYLKITLAVLKRRKFFTFISLFGISFTLIILILITAFLENLFSPTYPDTERNRSLYVNVVELRGSKTGYSTKGRASYYFLDHYVSTMKTPAKIAIVSEFISTNTYVNNKKLRIKLKNTNAEFWDVLQFKFIEGKPYTKQQIQNSELVTVISEDTKKDYFGEEASVVGKFIESDNVRYRVTGVVKSVSSTQMFSYADMYIPCTLSNYDLTDKSLTGPFSAILLANSESQMRSVQDEYTQLISKIPITDKNYDQLYSNADTYFETFTRQNIGNGSNSGMSTFIMVIGVFVFIFMLLPTLNLININISRIMDRSSEIGVRKAFGASSTTLVYQFIIENIFLTLIGGVIGLSLSVLILLLINSSNIIPNLELHIDFTVLLLSLLACFVFGLFSGAYPAWRMSRMQVVKALKAH